MYPLLHLYPSIHLAYSPSCPRLDSTRIYNRAGVDLSALEAVRDSMSFDKLLNQPEMQRFIDQVRCFVFSPV